ncbi:unnamed protein product [Schistosoma mattheei]|uniref:Uncharacterized protein n=1 Tax=Schistosoma mattheei TaxID=31246 RepID=A0A183PZC1_9TREM|nr:unnamed protein product [Schistosoma mattheei]
MFFNCKYAALALPIRAFTSASDPPCSLMMLLRYVKVFTSSKSLLLIYCYITDNNKYYINSKQYSLLKL